MTVPIPTSFRQIKAAVSSWKNFMILNTRPTIIDLRVWYKAALFGNGFQYTCSTTEYREWVWLKSSERLWNDGAYWWGGRDGNCDMSYTMRSYYMKDVSECFSCTTIDLADVISVVKFNYDNDGRMAVNMTRFKCNKWFLTGFRHDRPYCKRLSHPQHSQPQYKYMCGFHHIVTACRIALCGYNLNVRTADFINDVHLHIQKKTAGYFRDSTVF